MGRACGMYGGDRYLRDHSLNDSDQFGDVLVCDMLLNWTLKEQVARAWIVFIWLRIGTNGREL